MSRLRSLSLMAPLALIACAQAASASTIDVVKTPWCGCCSAWIERMQAAGFTLSVRDVEDTTPIAEAAGVPANLRSCHTATVEGYAIEGHVPAEDIRRLLEERPDAVGLSVPGMPIGSPGMEAKGRSDTYQTVLIMRDGKHKVWATHQGTATAHQH
ncbi:DUF411 domain-containing protein [Qipengyuania sp. 6B39]|uniref:DUF411 domain-containing protein n=1 Tax=Qipengyuania proteolytica TaxID=2867239 RepID=UPI001C8A01BF|nr:DUF411 domain-containing protein [Qipengyuania proteolytica]MBX7496243.1 DUF411 domain-containing protein [Qipengyuania proteolytica]